MKYNIQINQQVLSETDLDIIDGAILDYLYVYCSSRNKKIDEQRIKDEDGDWTWVNYQTLLKDMPLLKIKSSGALTPRIKRIKAAGYIETYRKGNQKIFIRMTEKADELFIKKNSSVHKDEQLPSKSYSPKRTNNNTRVYNNTKDKGRLTPAEEMELFLTSENYFNKILDALIEKGIPPLIAKNELIKFRSYWSERNKTGTKERWELERTFELKRRIATWMIKAQQFNNKSSPPKGKAIYNTLN